MATQSVTQESEPLIHLSTNEKARLASLNLDADNAEIIEYQKRLKMRLSQIYMQGDHETTKDTWKAQDYKAQVIPKAKISDTKLSEPDTADTRVRTKTLYDGLGWYTSTRLAFSRTNRIVDLTLKVSATRRTVSIGGSNVNLAALAGLSYGLELLADFAVLIKHVVKPDESEQHLSVWRRIKNAFFKDFRPSRMVNAIGWFTINLICLLPFARAIVGILNICLFAYDLVHDKFREKYAVYEDQQLLNKIDNRIIELNNLNLQANPELKTEHAYLHQQRTALLNNAEISNKAKTRGTRITAGIFTGMLMFYFPPLLLFAVAFSFFYAATEAPKNSYKRAGLILLGILATATAIGVLLFPPAQAAIASISAAVTLAGAVLSLLVGSVYGGFGTRLRNGPIGNFCSKIKNKISNSAFGQRCGVAWKFISESNFAKALKKVSVWLNKPYNSAEPETAIKSKVKIPQLITLPPRLHFAPVTTTPPSTVTASSQKESTSPLSAKIDPVSGKNSDSPPVYTPLSARTDNNTLLSPSDKKSFTTSHKGTLKRTASLKDLRAKKPLLVKTESKGLKASPSTLALQATISEEHEEAPALALSPTPKRRNSFSMFYTPREQLRQEAQIEAPALAV